MPDHIPSYAVGPFVGSVSSIILAALCLVALTINPRFRPLKSLALFYFSMSAYFVGFTLYAFQNSGEGIIWGYRLKLLGLAWLPVSWVWLSLALGNKPVTWAGRVVLVWSLGVSLILLAVRHPAVLGPPFTFQQFSGVMRPSSTIFRPMIYAVDLTVILGSIYVFWFRWRKRGQGAAYLAALTAGLILWFLSGFHDALYSFGLPFTFPQPILWLGSVWLSLCLAAAAALRWRDTDRELENYRDNLEILVDERTLELSEEVAQRRRAQGALTQLAAGVAHNFNNVLMAVMSNAQAAISRVGKGDAGPQTAEGLRNVVEAARAGRDVVSRLSQYVGQGERAVSRRKVVDLGELANSLESMVRSTWSGFRQGSMELALRLDPDLRIKGVWGELMEVFLNIVKNAVESCGQEGSLLIRGYKKEGMAVLEFSDNGRGADVDVLPHFFEPFFTTKGVKGQGLGLAVSKGIISAHQGEISALVNQAGGVTVIVSLPITDDPVSGALAWGQPSGGQGVRILLVEDEALVSMGISAILEQGGHQVLHASSVEQARAALAQSLPDLIICDMGLPDGQGWEVVHRLQESCLELTQTPPPVVVLSGWNAGQLADDDDCAPVAGILQKPVGRDELFGAIESAIAGTP